MSTSLLDVLAPGGSAFQGWKTHLPVGVASLFPPLLLLYPAPEFPPGVIQYDPTGGGFWFAFPKLFPAAWLKGVAPGGSWKLYPNWGGV